MRFLVGRIRRAAGDLRRGSGRRTSVTPMTDLDNPDPLTAAQVSKLHARLLAERSRLEGSEEALTSVRETRERSADQMDEAEASLVQHEALGRAAHDRSHSQLIERAILKIESGTYGVSELS